MKSSGVCDMNEKLKAKRLDNSDMEKVSGGGTGNGNAPKFSKGQMIYYIDFPSKTFCVDRIKENNGTFYYRIRNANNPLEVLNSVSEGDLSATPYPGYNRGPLH